MSHAKDGSTAAKALELSDPTVALTATGKDESKCSVNDDGNVNSWSAKFKDGIPYTVTKVYLQGRADVDHYSDGAK